VRKPKRLKLGKETLCRLGNGEVAKAVGGDDDPIANPTDCPQGCAGTLCPQCGSCNRSNAV
jgi:hypothetical protein